MLKLQQARQRDAADMSIIEFVDREGEARKAKPVTNSSASPSPVDA